AVKGCSPGDVVQLVELPALVIVVPNAGGQRQRTCRIIVDLRRCAPVRPRVDRRILRQRERRIERIARWIAEVEEEVRVDELLGVEKVLADQPTEARRRWPDEPDF